MFSVSVPTVLPAERATTQILAPGTCKNVKAMDFKRCSRGFTLIELLVALVIVGLLVGLIHGIQRPDERVMLQAEAERLAQLLHLAGSEALMSGKSIAWTTDGASYRFWRYGRGGGWSEIRGDDLFHERMLPLGMKIEGMKIEGTLAVIAAEPGAMRMEFTPHGLPPSYVINISLGRERYAVEGSLVGDVRAFSLGRKSDET
jgi:general secretion pathway protein H